MSMKPWATVSNHGVLELNGYLKLPGPVDKLRNELNKCVESCCEHIDHAVVWEAVEDLIVEYEDFRG